MTLERGAGRKRVRLGLGGEWKDNDVNVVSVALSLLLQCRCFVDFSILSFTFWSSLDHLIALICS